MWRDRAYCKLVQYTISAVNDGYSYLYTKKYAETHRANTARGAKGHQARDKNGDPRAGAGESGGRVLRPALIHA